MPRPRSTPSQIGVDRSVHRSRIRATTGTRGAPLDACMSELLGRANGLCKGKGGSMHLTSVEHRALGSYAIVGAHLPIACGTAWSARVRGTDQVTACHFGDGATNIGAFHEALNLAAIWKLPAVFVCENNGYAESTPVSYHCSASDIANRAGAYEIPGIVVDGLDVFAVYEAAGEAVARARRGEGPTLIEAKTYRYYGHFEGDTILYRTKEELDAYRQRDPIGVLRRYILEHAIASEQELDAINDRVQARLAQRLTECPHGASSPVSGRL